MVIAVGVRLTKCQFFYAASALCCVVGNCSAGQVANETHCLDCDVDYYQNETRPFKETVCLRCPHGTGTQLPASISETDCNSKCLRVGNCHYHL